MAADAGVFAVDGELSYRLMRDDPDDYAAMSRWLNDDRVLEWFGGRDRPRSLESITEKYRSRILHGGPTVSTLLLLDGRPIGFMQFYDLADVGEYNTAKGFGIEDPTEAFGVDLFIGEPDLWNRGLGSRAIRAFAEWLFRERGALTVYADPRAANGRSIRAFEKAGFSKVRLLPGHEHHEGRDEDCWLLAAGRPLASADDEEYE
jgi:aminoglycoside 6'-N-acetyltransferase